MKFVKSPWTPLVLLVVVGGSALGSLSSRASPVLWLCAAVMIVWLAWSLSSSFAEADSPSDDSGAVRFSLRELFVLTTIAALAAWGLTAPLVGVVIAFAVLYVLLPVAGIFLLMWAAVSLLWVLEQAIQGLQTLRLSRRKLEIEEQLVAGLDSGEPIEADSAYWARKRAELRRT